MLWVRWRWRRVCVCERSLMHWCRWLGDSERPEWERSMNLCWASPLSSALNSTALTIPLHILISIHYKHQYSDMLGKPSWQLDRHITCDRSTLNWMVNLINVFTQTIDRVWRCLQNHLSLKPSGIFYLLEHFRCHCRALLTSKFGTTSRSDIFILSSIRLFQSSLSMVLKGHRERPLLVRKI